MGKKPLNKNKNIEETLERFLRNIVPHEFLGLVSIINSELKNITTNQADSSYNNDYHKYITNKATEIEDVFKKQLEDGEDKGYSTQEIFSLVNVTIRPRLREIELISQKELRNLSKFSKLRLPIDSIRYQANRGNSYLEVITTLWGELWNELLTSDLALDNSLKLAESIRPSSLAKKVLARESATYRYLNPARVHIYEPMPTILNANYAAMFFVFRNIITNAYKYKKSAREFSLHIFFGNRPPEIKTNIPLIKPDDDFGDIHFLDLGIGIDGKKYKEKIFRPFNKGPIEDIGDDFFSEKLPLKSKGIGLTLAKVAVESHGGKLKYVSQLGVGTDFIIRLPRYLFSQQS